MSVRGPTGKFFFDRIHDLYLYYLVLEHHVYDEAKGDFHYTKSGEIKIEGGWSGIAEQMTAMFGREFKPDHVLRRYNLFCEKEEYLDALFNEVQDFRDDLVRLQEVMESVKLFIVYRAADVVRLPPYQMTKVFEGERYEVIGEGQDESDPKPHIVIRQIGGEAVNTVHGDFVSEHENEREARILVGRMNDIQEIMES